MSDGKDQLREAIIRRRDAGRAPADAGERAMAAEWDRQDAALAALYGPVADEPLPPRMRAALDAAALARGRGPVARIAAALALVALGAALGWGGTRLVEGPARGRVLAAEALRAHQTFAVEVRHPVEVAASDERHLVAWLSKRLGQPLTPPDFAARGFALVGGRVLPESGGTAAQLMYEDAAGRRVTLFVTRQVGAAETAFRYAEGDGAQGFWWIDEGLGCMLAGDLPREDLRALALDAYDQLL